LAPTPSSWTWKTRCRWQRRPPPGRLCGRRCRRWLADRYALCASTPWRPAWHSKTSRRLCCPHLDGVLLPKVDRPGELSAAEKRLEELERRDGLEVGLRLGQLLSQGELPTGLSCGAGGCGR
jgi:hypothetical protein